MSSNVELANRFREVTLNGTWIAQTNLQHQLAGLDWKIATASPRSLNTIATLARHLHYYINGILQVLRGGNLEISDRYAFDFPHLPSQQAWDEFLEKFRADAAAFANLVEHLPEEQLSATFIDPKYGTYRRNIEGMIEHCYYHLGQIVLIRKLLEKSG